MKSKGIFQSLATDIQIPRASDMKLQTLSRPPSFGPGTGNPVERANGGRNFLPPGLPNTLTKLNSNMNFLAGGSNIFNRNSSFANLVGSQPTTTKKKPVNKKNLIGQGILPDDDLLSNEEDQALLNSLPMMPAFSNKSRKDTTIANIIPSKIPLNRTKDMRDDCLLNESPPL